MKNNGGENREESLKVGHHTNMKFIHMNLRQKLKLHDLLHDDIISQPALIGRRCGEKTKVSTVGRKREIKSKSLFSVHLHFLPAELMWRSCDLFLMSFLSD